MSSSFAQLVNQYEESGNLIGTENDLESGGRIDNWFDGFSNSVSSSFSQARNNVNNALGNNNSQADNNSGENSISDGWATLSRSERFKGFVFLLLLSGFFFTLSFLFVGFVALMPAKFAFPFTMGSLSFMGAFAFMKGPSNWVKSVFSKEQAAFTVAYFLSIFGTLYACLVQRSYFLTLIFTVIQIGALAQYSMGNLPGGQLGLRMIFNFIKQMVLNVCLPCCKNLVLSLRKIVS